MYIRILHYIPVNDILLVLSCVFVSLVFLVCCFCCFFLNYSNIYSHQNNVQNCQRVARTLTFCSFASLTFFVSISQRFITRTSAFWSLNIFIQFLLLLSTSITVVYNTENYSKYTVKSFVAYFYLNLKIQSLIFDYNNRLNFFVKSESKLCLILN